MKLFAFAIVLAGFLGLQGCATILKGSTQPLSVNSNVDNADVVLNGAKIGQTPFTGIVKRSKTAATLEVRKEGYRPARVILDSEMEPVFFVNIISGGVFGSTTDYASESMWRYAPGTVNLDLHREAAAAAPVAEENEEAQAPAKKPAHRAKPATKE